MIEIGIQKSRDSDARANAHDGSEREHKTYHDTRKVGCKDTVYNDKDVFITECAEAKIYAGRE